MSLQRISGGHLLASRMIYVEGGSVSGGNHIVEMVDG